MRRYLGVLYTGSAEVCVWIAQVAVFIGFIREVEGVGAPEARPVTGHVVPPVQLLCLGGRVIRTLHNYFRLQDTTVRYVLLYKRQL